jgi:hypothetical protein
VSEAIGGVIDPTYLPFTWDELDRHFAADLPRHPDPDDQADKYLLASRRSKGLDGN